MAALPTGAIPAGTVVNTKSILANSVTLSNNLNYPISSGAPITFYRKSQGFLYPNVLMIPDQGFNPFSSTTVQYGYKGYYVNGSTGALDLNYTPISPNKNYNYPNKYYYVAPASETFRQQINCTIKSPYVSPVFNNSRANVVQIQNLINNISGFNTTLNAAAGATGVVLDTVTTLGATGIGVVQNIGVTGGYAPPSGSVIINGNEQIVVTGATGATGLSVVRGYNNSIPAATGPNASLTTWAGSITVNDATRIFNGDIIQFGKNGATGIGPNGFVPGIEYIQVLRGGKVSGVTTLNVLRGYNGATGAAYLYGATGVNAVVNDVSDDETQPTGGGALAKYISRPVVLTTNATYLKVFLTSNKPANTNVLVYYKVLSADDSSSLTSKPWVQMQQVSPAASTFSTNPTNFQEYQFLPYANNCVTNISGGIDYNSIAYTYNGVTYTNFIEYAIKIVLLSPDATQLPLVSDLRIMALE